MLNQKSKFRTITNRKVKLNRKNISEDWYWQHCRSCKYHSSDVFELDVNSNNNNKYIDSDINWSEHYCSYPFYLECMKRKFAYKFGKWLALILIYSFEAFVIISIIKFIIERIR